jgi:hypothetical protein
MALNGRMVTEDWIGKDTEGSGRGLFRDNTQLFPASRRGGPFEFLAYEITFLFACMFLPKGAFTPAQHCWQREEPFVNVDIICVGNKN